MLEEFIVLRKQVSRRATLVFTAAFCAALLPTPALASGPSLEDVFKDPPKDARPRVRWWWPGAAVTTSELQREIRVLDEAGFGGAEIQAFNPGIPGLTKEDRARVDEFAEPSFFQHVKTVAEAAAERGLSLDYTLGSAWPSGGGFAITPEKALVELTMAVTAVRGGSNERIKVSIPPRTKRLGAFSALDPRSRDPRASDWPKRHDERARIVSVVAMKGSLPALKPAGPTAGFKLYPWDDVLKSGRLQMETAVDLTGKLSTDGTLDWNAPEGEWQIFVFKQYASNMGVLGSAGRGPQLVLDHMDPSALAAHIGRVGEPLVRSLGSSKSAIRSTFVDSLELMQDIPWTENFLPEFKRRRGYDLTPYLPFVLQPGWSQAWGEHYSPPYFEDAGDIAERVRADYRRTISDMMFDGFLRPWVAWNQAQGFKTKFQAHGGAIDILKGYGIADIPETEDLVHGGDPYFMRFARSAANLYSRPTVSAESLVWINRPYSVTPDELRRRADLILASGVTSMIYHGFNYRMSADEWPGWHAFQPSAFAAGFSGMLNESNPIWAAVPVLNRHVTRLQSVLSAGKSIVPVAYFYGQSGYYVGIEDKGAGKQAIEKGLIASGYDYDRINPESVRSARVSKRKLLAGKGEYSALVLPHTEGIDAEVIERISAFAKAGLPVIFVNAAPTREQGFADYAARDGRVRVAVREILRHGGRVVPEQDLVRAIDSVGATPNLRFTSTNSTDLIFVQRRIGKKLVTFLHNRADLSRDASLQFPVRGGVTRWNTQTGSINPVRTSKTQWGTAVPLQLRAGESALLVADPSAKFSMRPEPKVLARLPIGATNWIMSANGHGPNGVAVRRELGSVSLGDWTSIEGLERFSGSATYRREINVPAGWLSRGNRVHLDLGTVRDMAAVSVNGTQLPLLITSPFKVDISDAVKAGSNDLVVKVSNTPNNAMIDAKRAGFRDLKPVAAGLEGPIVLELQH